MKRLICIFTLLMIICLTSCGKDIPPGGTQGTDVSSKAAKPEKAYTVQEVEAAIAEALGDGYYCDTEKNAENIEYTFFADLDFSKLDSYILKVYNDDVLKLDTTAVLNCKEDYVDTAIDKLNFFLAASYRYVKAYPFSVTSLSKVENARLFRHGNTVILVLGGSDLDETASEEEKAEHALDEYKKVDKAVKELYGELPENIADIEGAFKKYYPGESLN